MEITIRSLTTYVTFSLYCMNYDNMDPTLVDEYDMNKVNFMFPFLSLFIA